MLVLNVLKLCCILLVSIIKVNINKSKFLQSEAKKKKIIKINKSLYLSVSVFSTLVLIGDMVNKETNIVNKKKLVKKSLLEGGRPVGYLQSMQELSSGPPKTNPSSGREENLNPGPPAYKSSALTTRPRSPP